jgi:EAL domain-containing protein (putative c-di-GMP-specific phosphodiesterase class I)
MALPGRTLLHQEVMARLLDENGSVVPAAQFLPMAARHGLMPRLDLGMIRKLIARIGNDKESRARISLNIAAQTIADQDATRQLFDLLLANPQLASRLVFEMTEFGAVRDAAVTGPGSPRCPRCCRPTSSSPRSLLAGWLTTWAPDS